MYKENELFYLEKCSKYMKIETELLNYSQQKNRQLQQSMVSQTEGIDAVLITRVVSESNQ